MTDWIKRGDSVRIIMARNDIFLVIEKGVYRHDIWGPFSTQKDAEAKAKEISSEGVKRWGYSRNDGWHDYEVHLLDGYLEDSLTPLAVFRSGKRVSP